MENFANLLELADGLHSAAIHLLRQVRVEDREEGIGPAQLSALSVLVFGGSMTLGELAAIEQVKPPTMVRIVQSLAKQRLLRTSIDREDRRKRNLSATQRGRRLMMRARQRRVEALARRIRALSHPEQQTLQGALKVLRRLQAVH
jgi:DNA-binding MarR family transcriptional regulator